MERAEENPSKLLRKLDLIFVPSSLIRHQIKDYKEGASEFNNKDYTSLSEMMFLGEQIIKFGAFGICELARGMIYVAGAIKLLDYLQ